MSILTLGRAAPFRSYVVIGIARPRDRRGETISDASWRNTLIRLAELGFSPGRTVVKTGSAGPGCPVIVLAGGSRTAISPGLCDLILVRPVGNAGGAAEPGT